MPGRGSKWGAEHQALRKRLIARFRPGDLCARCGRPMWALYEVSPKSGRRLAAVQLGHRDDGPGWTGLEHARCNESAGGAKGTARQGKKSRQRTCPYCHAPFTASRASQEACSREHAAALARGDRPLPRAGRQW